MRGSFGFSISILFLVTLFCATASSEDRFREKRQAGTTLRKWANNIVYYYWTEDFPQFNIDLVNRVLKDIIEQSTCITFIFNSTARNRVKIFQDLTIPYCETSHYGCKGGEQTIRMGYDCKTDGQLMRAAMGCLAFYSMETRYDRNTYLAVNSKSVDPSKLSSLNTINSTYSTNPLPYNYGSCLHRGYDEYAYIGSTDYPIISTAQEYYLTMGSGIISSYDLNVINKFYYCNSSCPNNQIVCQNSGHLNTRSCASCNCPLSYAGTNCNTIPSDGGSQVTATTSWQTLTITVTGSASIASPGAYTTKTYWIVKPAMYNYVQIEYVSFNGSYTYCQPGCKYFGLEVKYKADQELTCPRVCCSAFDESYISSNLSITRIVAYTSTISVTFVLRYKANSTWFVQTPPPEVFVPPTTTSPCGVCNTSGVAIVPNNPSAGIHEFDSPPMQCTNEQGCGTLTFSCSGISANIGVSYTIFQTFARHCKSRLFSYPLNLKFIIALIRYSETSKIDKIIGQD
ncbi:hypothetical protein WR25_16280 isoform A [Diploscapter pachys]|uniref:Peptidase M12A domain-containing protein n=1 Tax=Diploscapter pachys TaxID=2018661 RepID=A0A2A2L8M7_9BILA|nr:hypothetical protein WR25_16280 isoform A [Diploscapter pachys]